MISRLEFCTIRIYESSIHFEPTFCNSANNFELSENKSIKWAGPDLNRRPLARKANVLTKLDDRPILQIKSAMLIFNFSF